MVNVRAAILGKRMADRVDRLFEKTGKMVQGAGITPQPVSDKLIVEIVRGASLEDDEDQSQDVGGVVVKCGIAGRCAEGKAGIYCHFETDVTR